MLTFYQAQYSAVQLTFPQWYDTFIHDLTDDKGIEYALIWHVTDKKVCSRVLIFLYFTTRFQWNRAFLYIL